MDNKKREKVIKGLEEAVDFISTETSMTVIEQWVVRDALALLKAQGTGLERIAEDHGITIDGVSFALDQYQTIICEITHGMMSKLSYHASDVLQMAQERWCDTCELKEAQEPVKPVQEKRRGGYFRCGNCNARVSKVFGDKYCSQCGRPVKWE